MNAFGKEHHLRMLAESVSQCSKVLNAVSDGEINTVKFN